MSMTAKDAMIKTMANIINDNDNNIRLIDNAISDKIIMGEFSAGISFDESESDAFIVLKRYYDRLGYNVEIDWGKLIFSVYWNI